jgi:opacity protein-like surface antigen
MIRKLTLALLLTLPTMAVAIDLDGYYITPKVGVSKSMNTGGTDWRDSNASLVPMDNDDLGTGNAFGLSVGKYLTGNFRLELEVTKRTGYKFDGVYTNFNVNKLRSLKAKIQTEALFVNGFYDFQPFSISNMPITPYLGGGVGISRNKMRA